MDLAGMHFELLTENHHINDFSCGDTEEDLFLKDHALNYQKAGLAATTVGVRNGEVLGFSSLCNASIWPDNLPRSARVENLKLAIPATLLAHIALTESLRGRGLGRIFMAHALRTCVRESSIIAARVVLLDARNDRLINYYSRFGFRSLAKNPSRMYVKMRFLRSRFPEEIAG